MHNNYRTVLNKDEALPHYDIEKYKTSYVSRKAYINLIYRLSSQNKYNKLIQNYENIGWGKSDWTVTNRVRTSN